MFRRLACCLLCVDFFSVFSHLFSTFSSNFPFRWSHMGDFPRRNLPQNVVGNSFPTSGNPSHPSIELSTTLCLPASVCHHPSSEWFSTLCDLRRLWNLPPMLSHLSSGRLSRRQPVSSLSSYFTLLIGSKLQPVSLFLIFRFGVYIPKFLREITQDSSGVVNFHKILRLKNSATRHFFSLETFSSWTQEIEKNCANAFNYPHQKPTLRKQGTVFRPNIQIMDKWELLITKYGQNTNIIICIMLHLLHAGISIIIVIIIIIIIIIIIVFIIILHLVHTGTSQPSRKSLTGLHNTYRL